MSDPPPLAARLHRRQLLQRLGGGLGSLGLWQGLQHGGYASSVAHHRPRAQRVIQLFMNGGPHGADLFDPKPLLVRYAGQRPAAVNLRTERRTGGILPSPFRFSPAGQSGLMMSELLPRTAQWADDMCIIRSVHSDNPNHGPALLLMNNGTILPTRPSMGAWLSYGLGSENADLPAYIVLCPGKVAGRSNILWTSAFLPSEHQGIQINHSDLDPNKMVPYLRNPVRSRQAQREQLDLLQQLNAEHLTERDADPDLTARMKAMETAFRMQSTAHVAFDVEQEPASLRAAYGTSQFGQGCLLARRLSERGVRFVQLYYANDQPWDTHSDHDQRVRTLCQDIDGPIAALLGDLKQRGLLDETLVLWGGEFGRTPVSEGNSGRDHNHFGFCVWMAGGGIRGGQSYGATDDFGFRAVEQRVHIHDLHATILHALGIDHQRLTYRYAGRDFRLTDVHGRVVNEILA